MKFTLAIHHPHDPHALKFAAAAVDAGHEISLAFFYHDGVFTADAGNPSENQAQWLALADRHQIPLAVCIGAAARRALVDESRPESGSVRQGFDVVGLGQFAGALVDSDRLITFAG